MQWPLAICLRLFLYQRSRWLAVCSSGLLVAPGKTTRAEQARSLFRSRYCSTLTIRSAIHERLRVDTTLFDGEGHTINGEHVGGDAVVHVVSLNIAHYIVKAVAEDGLQLLVDDGFLPEVSLAVLHPFKITSCNAASISQDVGHNEDALFGEDFIGHCGGGTVCTLDDDAGLDLAGVAAGDYVFGCGWDENLAFGDQELFAWYGLSAAETKGGTVAILVLNELVNIDTRRVVEAAIFLGNTDNLVSLLQHEASGI